MEVGMDFQEAIRILQAFEREGVLYVQVGSMAPAPWVFVHSNLLLLSSFLLAGGPLQPVRA
jgi:hypothetical protein